MSVVLTVISSILLLGGAFFVLVGGLGLLRLPDFYTRLHGAGVMETLGASLILFGKKEFQGTEPSADRPRSWLRTAV